VQNNDAAQNKRKGHQGQRPQSGKWWSSQAAHCLTFDLWQPHEQKFLLEIQAAENPPSANQVRWLQALAHRTRHHRHEERTHHTGADPATWQNTAKALLATHRLNAHEHKFCNDLATQSNTPSRAQLTFLLEIAYRRCTDIPASLLMLARRLSTREAH
jgi:hypothetical protein